MINSIKKFINKNSLDGYILPKNDTYFTEYSKTNNLKKVTNFTGSAGFALILKNENYLFVDGRYTLQAKIQTRNNFIIKEIPKKWPKNLTFIKNYNIGFDPKLFTEDILHKYFDRKVNLIAKAFYFKNTKKDRSSKFFFLNKSIAGQESKNKINQVINFLKKVKIDYLYMSASENVCWLLNIRGYDLPNSPLANCKIIISDKKEIYLFTDIKKISNIRKKLKKNIKFFNEDEFFKVINHLKRETFCIDEKTCSTYEESLIKSKFKILQRNDPVYYLKSLKNKTEIKNMINCHVTDGVALTKFMYWFKKLNKEINEKKIELKLENLRRKSKSYLYPSFDTIAGSGPNGSIIHYKSNKKTNRKLKKNDILLLDSGGQYKWGTTDVTRTMCLGKVSNEIKNNFTRVLKGHIAVVSANLNKKSTGDELDKVARISLREKGLDYSHGTGHGVGFFLNVHEGPQGIYKQNKVILKEGMILSNEPGYYLENKYGIRIENLIYVKYEKRKLIFRNLTLAPIDVDLINFKMLTKFEKKYLFDYHLDVYKKISSFLNENEKKWLVKLIK